MSSSRRAPARFVKIGVGIEHRTVVQAVYAGLRVLWTETVHPACDVRRHTGLRFGSNLRSQDRAPLERDLR
jgi:hypothetical protein